MEEESMEDSDSQILHPFWWVEESNSEIWAIRADLVMKDGNFEEACRRISWKSFSENGGLVNDWEENDGEGELLLLLQFWSWDDLRFDNGVLDDFFFDFEDIF